MPTSFKVQTVEQHQLYVVVTKDDGSTFGLTIARADVDCANLDTIRAGVRRRVREALALQAAPLPPTDLTVAAVDAGVDQSPDEAPVLPPTADELEAQALVALNNGGGQIDLRKLLKAKFISDLAFRLGKAPSALTLAELNAERQRIANIYKAL